MISNVDYDLTCILQKRSKRGEASLFCEMNKEQKIKEIGEDILCQNLSDDEIFDSEEKSNGYNFIEQVTSTRSRESEKMERNNNEYPILAEMADRFNSSNREVAALVNAALKDLRLLTRLLCIFGIFWYTVFRWYKYTEVYRNRYTSIYFSVYLGIIILVRMGLKFIYNNPTKNDLKMKYVY